jgi:hypothetical protein
LGRRKRCGLVGEGVLLGMGFEVSKTHTIPSSLSLSLSPLFLSLSSLPPSLSLLYGCRIYKL